MTQPENVLQMTIEVEASAVVTKAGDTPPTTVEEAQAALAEQQETR